MTGLEPGELAIVPTDTVYGIACGAADQVGLERIYALKERPSGQPTAVIFGSLAALEAALPEIPARVRRVAAEVFPGPVTLVVPNPARRLAHLCGDTPEQIGVRVPVLDAEVAALADACGGLAATSANLRGQPPAAELAEVPAALRAAAAVVIDGGRVGGAASCVVDVCAVEPHVLRDGPGCAAVLRAVG